VIDGYSEHAEFSAFVHRWLNLTRPAALSNNAKQGWMQFRCLLALASSPARIVEFFGQPAAVALTRAAIKMLGRATPNIEQRALVIDLIDHLLRAREADADTVGPVIDRHVSTLLQSLHKTMANPSSMLVAPSASMKRSKLNQLASNLRKRVLRVLTRIALFARDTAGARALVDLLLPYLSLSKRNPLSTMLDGLATVGALLACVPREYVERAVLKAAPLLSVAPWERPPRDALSRFFLAAAATGQVPSLAAIAPLVARLNAFSDAHLDASDIETQLAALRELRELEASLLVASMPRFAVPLVLHSLLVLMRVGNNLSLRTASTACMCSLVQALSSAADAGVPVDVEGELAYGSDEWHKARAAAARLIFSTVLEAIELRPPLVRSGFLSVLGALVEFWPQYRDIAVLCAPVTEDSDVSFFHALSGSPAMQVFALRMLASLSHTYAEHRILQLFVPLTLRLMTDAEYQRSPQLASQLLKTLAALAAPLGWTAYLAVLKKVLAAAASIPKHQSMLMTAVCTLLDSFRFDARLAEPVTAASGDGGAGAALVQPAEVLPVRDADDGAAEDEKDDDEAAGGDGDDDDDDDDGDDDEPETMAAAAQKARRSAPAVAPKFASNEVQEGMLKQVMPTLYALLGAKRVVRAKMMKRATRAGAVQAVAEAQHDVAFVAICEVTVKVLLLLPRELLMDELPVLVTRLVTRLRDRDFETREAARTALAGLAAAVGATYLPFIFAELRTALTRGFERHVLAHTLHAILQRLRSVAKPGDLDAATEQIALLLLESVVGDVASEKEVAAIVAATPEAKQNGALSAFRLLAEMIDFERSVSVLLSPVISLLVESESAAVESHVARIVAAIRGGLMENASLNTRALLLFVHGHLSVRLDGAAAASASAQESAFVSDPAPATGGLLRDRLKRSSETDNFELQPDPRKQYQRAHHSERKAALQMAHLAVAMLTDALTRKRLLGSSVQRRPLLEPFIPRLADAMRSVDNALVSAAIACVTSLVSTGVVREPRYLARLTRRTFALIDRLPGKSAMMGDAIGLLTTIVNGCGALLQLDSGQLTALARFISAEISSLERSARTFALLQAVLRQRLPLAEIYALMERISQLAVSSEDDAIRAGARRLFVNFLVDYPMSDKALDDHLAFVVTNMRNFQFELGRLSCVELLMQLFERMPPALLTERAEFFFLPLVAALAGDEVPRCRAAVTEAARLLFARLDGQRVATLLALTLRWFSEAPGVGIGALEAKRSRLRTTGAQVLRLFGGIALPRDMAHTALSAVSQALRDAVAELPDVLYERAGDSGDLLDRQWKWLYHTLSALERFVTSPSDDVRGELVGSGQHHDVFSLAVQFLPYPHAWVRRVACRVVGCGFALCAAADDGWFASAPPAALQLTEALCSQLESPHLTDDHSEQVIKNLLVLLRHAIALGAAIDVLVVSSPRVGSAGRDEATAAATTAGERDAQPNADDEVRHDDGDDDDNDGDDDDNDGDDEEEDGDGAAEVGGSTSGGSKVLQWVIQRCSFIARRGREPQKRAVFMLYAAATLQLGSDAMQPLLRDMIVPLQQVQAQAAQRKGKKSKAPLVRLANEVVNLLQTKCDALAFADAFNEVLRDKEQKRVARIATTKKLELTNPERAAELRRRKQVRKRKLNSAEAAQRRLRESVFDPLQRGKERSEE
jgi:U3 small nucleolar RNA-associated protein 20